jgi:hypothetical protein
MNVDSIAPFRSFYRYQPQYHNHPDSIWLPMCCLMVWNLRDLGLKTWMLLLHCRHKTSNCNDIQVWFPKRHSSMCIPISKNRTGIHTQMIILSILPRQTSIHIVFEVFCIFSLHFALKVPHFTSTYATLFLVLYYYCIQGVGTKVKPAIITLRSPIPDTL